MRVMHYPIKPLKDLIHKNLATVHDNWTEDVPKGSTFPGFTKFFKDTKLALSAQTPVEGTGLSEWLQKEAYKKLDARVDVMRQICEAIQYLHSKDIIHGNLWPKTIFVTKTKDGPTAGNVVKLVTFGWHTLHKYSAPESVRLFLFRALHKYVTINT